MHSNDSTNSVKPFFEPSSVAVIGASRTPGKGGYNVINNMLTLNYKGKIYPINPEAEEILGLKVYPNIRDIPEVPELAVILLPAALVLPSVKECIDKGVKNLVIVSSGFSELDEKGAEIERRLAWEVRQSGVRVMGPNSAGTISPREKFSSSFIDFNIVLPSKRITPGSIAFIGQTGLLNSLFLSQIDNELGLSKTACLGNKCDIDECDLLEYAAGDTETRVIAMYLESINNGRRFFQLAKRVVRDKPIIIFKSARTAAGAEVSASHTGSLAGEDRVYDAAFKQLGIIRVNDFTELFDMAKTFAYLPPLKGNRLALVSMTGAGGVIATDACTNHNLKMATLSSDTVEKMKAVYPPWWVVKNPVDVYMATETSGFEVTYTTLTRAALEDSGVEAVVAVIPANEFRLRSDIPSLFKDIKKEHQDKALLIAGLLGERRIYDQLCRGFRELNIPTYTTIEGAIKGLAALYWYQQYRSINSKRSWMPKLQA